MKPLIIGETILEDGSFLLCVTLTPESLEELREDLLRLKVHDFSLIEWRVDFLKNQSALIETVKAGIAIIKDAFPEKPLLFTYRWQGEGGRGALEAKNLLRLRSEIIEEHRIELIDMELYWFRDDLEEEIRIQNAAVLQRAKELGVLVLLSWHDFSKTPEEDFLLKLLMTQEKSGADLAKITAMATTSKDAERIMSVSIKASKVLGIPHIALAMGEPGKGSRTDGGRSRTCITFAPLSAASAPGQLQLDEMEKLLKEGH